MPPLLARWAVLNVTVAGLLAASWWPGWLEAVLLGDDTRMVWAIAALFAAGLILSGVLARTAAPCPHRVEHLHTCATWLVRLGLIGTVVGFLVAFNAVDPEQAHDLAAMKGMVAGVIAGMKTAFLTTLAGLVLGLWTEANARLLERPAA